LRRYTSSGAGLLGVEPKLSKFLEKCGLSKTQTGVPKMELRVQNLKIQDRISLI